MFFFQTHQPFFGDKIVGSLTFPKHLGVSLSPFASKQNPAAWEYPLDAMPAFKAQNVQLIATGEVHSKYVFF